jgi:prepilin-type N-terminal cleavage/methylation domain-containing protein
MKTTQRKGKAAFTLIELMAVITIIVILAGLVVGGLGFVTERQAKEKAKVQIALISKALEEYKLDTGSYPATGNSGANSAALYQALFYEGYDYEVKQRPEKWVKTVGSNTEFPKATKIYLPDLDPTTSKQGWVTPVIPPAKPSATSTILDPWGKEYSYRSALSTSGAANTGTQNPDFDLWSFGKDGVSDPVNKIKDDIRNF